MPDRTYEVVVFGATGFAGRLTALYLQDTYGGDVRWAVAGRNQGKLDALVQELADRRPDAPPVPSILADSADLDSLKALAEQTDVVCTTVGPYAKYGLPMVQACAESGTHYADLTGEPPFIRDSIDQFDAVAKASGARIAHSCGFDSEPSDLGVFLLQQAAIEAFGEPCDEIEFIVWWMKGGFSGGTLASGLNMMDAAADKTIRRVLADPYGLCDERGPDRREQMGPRYSEAAASWTGPFVMAGVNEKVVRRSNELLGHRYGKDFRYGESMRMGKGTGARLKAIGLSAAMGVGVAALAVGPVRRLVGRKAMQPGEGPSEEDIEKGGFEARLFGLRGGAVAVEVRVKGDRDPGYGATACMLAETGLGLARHDALGPAGVTTPAAALGQALIERLNPRQVHFEVVKVG